MKAVAEFNEPLGPGLELTTHKEGLEQDSDSGMDVEKAQKAEVSNQSDSVTHLGAQKAPSSYSGISSNGVFTHHGCPPHGAKAIIGSRPRMEDAFTAVPFLLEVQSLSISTDRSALLLSLSA